MMMLFLALLGALAQHPEPSPPPENTDPSKGWATVDRIMVVVNQDVITESELRRALSRVSRERKLTSDAEFRSAQQEILTDIVRTRLRVQAGAVLGIDEKLIDARVAESLERMRKNSNGVVGLVKFLQSRDVEGTDVRRLLREDIYDQIYHDGVTGEAPGPLGRVVADRYIRPGQLDLYYVQAIDRPVDMEALGGSVGRVKFQQIVLDVMTLGGAEATQQLARDLIARIGLGEDMGVLVRKYAGEGEGIAEVEEPRLRELFPEIAAFTSRAQEGQVSEPIATVLRGQRQIVRIIRFLDRTPAVVPDLLDEKVQATLRERAQARIEQYRLESGYATLIAGAYVWPTELAGRAKR